MALKSLFKYHPVFAIKLLIKALPQKQKTHPFFIN